MNYSICESGKKAAEVEAGDVGNGKGNMAEQCLSFSYS